MLVPIALGLLGLLAYKSQSSTPAPAMTPYRRLIFQTALAKDNPPLTGSQLRGLAAQFDSYGLTSEANILNKRARIMDLTPAQQAAIKTAFQKGLNSKDPIAVRALANTLEAESFFGNAAKLRDYANGLDVSAQIAAVQAQKAAQASQAAVIANATPEEHAAAHAAVTGTTITGAPAQKSTASDPGPVFAGMQKLAGTAGAPISDAIANSGLPGASTLAGAAKDGLGAATGAASSAVTGALPDVENAAKNVIGSIF